jgi:hypothetical protein
MPDSVPLEVVTVIVPVVAPAGTAVSIADSFSGEGRCAVEADCGRAGQVGAQDCNCFANCARRGLRRDERGETGGNAKDSSETVSSASGGHSVENPVGGLHQGGYRVTPVCAAVKIVECGQCPRWAQFKNGAGIAMAWPFIMDSRIG